MAKQTPNFTKVLSSMRAGKILTPIIRAALYSPDFAGFSVDVEPWRERPYDGWFHPSKHATWTARQLAYYLMDGDKIPPKQPELSFVMAVTQGKFWHDFIQKLLIKQKAMIQAERFLEDLFMRRRGHTDGVLSNGELFEFKTANENAARFISNVEDLKKYKPDYYAQTQDYMDMAGVDRMRYLVLTPAFPFPMEEYVVHADPLFQAAQRLKYHAAIEAARTGVLPDPCCAIGSKEARQCPTSFLCPIGRVK